VGPPATQKAKAVGGNGANKQIINLNKKYSKLKLVKKGLLFLSKTKFMPSTSLP